MGRMRLSKLLNSNRTGHMTAAIATGLSILAISTQIYDPNIQSITRHIGFIVPLWELLATPDMDHNSRRMGGSLFRRLWVLFWLPYQKLVKHRSKWSHSIIPGTLARMAYVWVLPLLIIGAGFDAWMVPFIVAPIVADTVHLLKDGYLRRYGVKSILFGK